MGLAPERLELRGHSPSVEEHLAAYNDVDIALDTFPYTGCTTTADALWMGVPVLTVAGDSMVSRQAAAVLRGVGCDEWICSHEAAMVEQAICLTKDLEDLKQRRLQQRHQLSNSELLNHADLAANLETVFRHWWLKWLKEQSWPTETKQQIWPQNNTTDICAPSAPITNSVAKRLPLWLGALPDAERQRRISQGQRVVALQNLQAWGEAVTLFANEQPGEVLVWIENGASVESQRWWKHTYPQLVWETKGPLVKAMKLLLVHQNFPGQFRDLAQRYAIGDMS